jgi:phosphohistidine phosphatase
VTGWTAKHRRLYLLRHAKSSWEDPALDDEDRPLADRGLRAAAKIAQYARKAGIRPDLILCSPALRTRQTLECIVPSLGSGVDVSIERELYTADDELLIRRLRRVPETARSVMLIAHNPGLQDLALRLIGQSRSAGLERKFPAGALATLAVSRPWADLRDGQTTLVDFIMPKKLGRAAL